MKKKKMLIFHSALAPYRIDQFNSLGNLFDLEVVFYLNNLPNFKYDQKYLKELTNFKISYLLKGIGKRERYFRFGVYKKIIQSKPDYILSYEYSPTTHYLLALKKIGLISQSIGTMVDDSLDLCYNPRTKARKFSRKIVLKNIDYLVLLSEEVSELYQKELKISTKQIVISPILQRPSRLRENVSLLELTAREYLSEYNLQGKKILLYVGRFSEEKALPDFLKNIHTLLQENDNLIFVLVGEGEERNKLENIIKEKSLENKVIFVGRYEAQALHAWYLCGSGLILPSISETFGAVVNESLIFGTKVLCSKLAGAATLINSNNGLVFNPLNSEETIEKTKDFISVIKPISNIDLSKSISIMNCHPDDFVAEWKKIENL